MSSHWLHFHFTFFETIDVTSLLEMPLRLERRFSEPLGEIIERLMELNDRGVCDPLHAAAFERELGWRALRIVVEASQPTTRMRRLLQEAGRLHPVLRHVREHLPEPLTVEALAHVSHLSIPRFHVFFREHLGMSPMEYVKTVRLGEARRLLSGSEHGVAEIAARVGFANAFHFSREFKKAFGQSPSEYRRSASIFVV